MLLSRLHQYPDLAAMTCAQQIRQIDFYFCCADPSLLTPAFPRLTIALCRGSELRLGRTRLEPARRG